MFKVGDRVKSELYGEGVITSIGNDDRFPINVHFDNREEQSFKLVCRYTTEGGYWSNLDASPERNIQLITEEKQMKKSDLKTGMVVVLGNGKEYKVLLDTGASGDILTNLIDENWADLADYQEDLTPDPYYITSSIDKIYDCHVYSLKKKGELLWERPKEEKVEELTVAEISERLGVKIKVIEG